MFLKSLELQGFKSFADKTVLDLSSNITAVVGPNGSGKSNITDAIRWLLGERDARNLRGGKVEDLIFAGTDKKPRLGQAQATLYFDNSSKFFPVDFNEVSISRKVTRDGDSLFFLNKAEVRLKDVIDFFAKAKLGARGLTIINQGSSDIFIKSTPIERKEMIEEILGLKEYQIKKNDSIRKLKNTAINLETVNAALQELKPHLKFLRRQVSRYEERDAMAIELRSIEDNFYGRKFKLLKSDLAKYKSELEGIKELIHEEDKIYKELELNLQKIKVSEPESAEEFRELENQKNSLLAKRANFQREFGRLEARIEFESKAAGGKDVDAMNVLREIKDIAESISAESDVAQLKAKVNLMLEKINEAFSGSSKIGNNSVSLEMKELQDKLTADLTEIDTEIKDLTSKEELVRKSLADFNKIFTNSHEEAQKQKKKLDGLTAEGNKLDFDVEKTDLKIANLKEELMQAGRSLTSVENVELEELGQTLSDDETMKRMFKLRGDLASIGEVDENLVKEAKETEDRFNFLTNQVSDLENATRDLKILIKDLDQKIHHDFTVAIKTINDEFIKLIQMMFGGGTAKLVIKTIEPKSSLQGVGDEENPSIRSSTEAYSKSSGFADGRKKSTDPETENEHDIAQGIEIELGLPKKRIKGLDVLSGGERTLVSIAVLFALISVSPPPFLVLDEVDAALDEANARRCGNILKEFSKKSQFVVVTHNRATMESADVLYGVTMQNDGTSKLLSLKLNDAETA